MASTSALAMMAAHGVLAKGVLAAEPADASKLSPSTRFKALRLQTSTPLNELSAYYRTVLEMPIVAEAESKFTIEAGESRITFVPAAPGIINPFYHFAFNIPENKVRSALEWLRARGSVLSTPPRLRDPQFPDEVRHFRRWDAHSVFFLDPAGNVLEYIGRHTLDNAAGGAFTSRDVLCVSEIAFVVDEVGETASRIEAECDLKQYQSGSDQFRAAGDENGLLLVIKRGRELGTGSGSSRKGDVFPTEASINSGRALRHAFAQYPYLITGV